VHRLRQNSEVISQTGYPRAGRRIGDPPSIVALAADALRTMILSGQLAPGDRVVENRVSDELGVSRPPLREAMKMLENEGLIRMVPRRGAIVTPMTLQDMYEIVTLRAALEQMAVRLGVPVPSSDSARSRLDRLRDAIETLETNAALGREDLASNDSFAFHLALVGLAGHKRLEDDYRAMALQLRLYMNMNRRVRAPFETLVQRAARHRALFELVVVGDAAAVIAALTGPDSLSIVREVGPTLPPGSDEAAAWLRAIVGE
jgi:DNA-binding GntR family transcriptional regulator